VSRSRDRVSLAVAGLQLSGAVTVSFPVHQPGTSAMVGYYEFEGTAYVLKVPKTAEVRNWSAASFGMREPAKVRWLRPAWSRWNSLEPRPEIWPTLEHLNELCYRWLLAVPRPIAEMALSQVRGAAAPTIADLADELFANQSRLRFSPNVSSPVHVTFVDGGPTDTFAVVQDCIGTPNSPGVAFSRRYGQRSRVGAERVQDIACLTLMACAKVLANEKGLGLDLVPRVGMRTVAVPNLLVRSDHTGLAFVDYFGLAQRDGNTIEAGAFHALYGRQGLVPHMTAWLYRGLTQATHARWQAPTAASHRTGSGT
jgi:hypothetical protein